MSTSFEMPRNIRRSPFEPGQGTYQDPSKPLVMVRLVIQAKAVLAHAQQYRVYSEQQTVIDWGYFLHLYLTDLFGDCAPRPFFIDECHVDGRALQTSRLVVLGYTTLDRETLSQDAMHFADPGVWSGVDWSQTQTKPMPLQSKVGQRFGFKIRCLPASSPNRLFGQEKETDIYLVRRARGDDSLLDRSKIYSEWLRGQFEKQQGARMLQAYMTRFSISTMVRREVPKGGLLPKNILQLDRAARTFMRPDAVLEGQLTVNDLSAFQLLLRNGLTRHRAFGFGMILLRRAAS